MVDTKELQIGNYLLAFGSFVRGLVQVERFSKDHITTDRLSGPPEWFLPVPLTYDVLLLCGFTDYADNKGGCRLYIGEKIELCFYNPSGLVDGVRYQTRSNGFTSAFGITTLHKLQNFYPFPTGKDFGPLIDAYNLKKMIRSDGPFYPTT